MPKAMINHPNAVKLLDLDDPNDNAFKLVIIFVFCCDVIFSKKKNSIFGPNFTNPDDPFCINSQTKAADDRLGGRWWSG